MDENAQTVTNHHAIQISMSLVESPVHSSSSDDFAGLLERELKSSSSESSPEEEDEDDKEADGDQKHQKGLDIVVGQESAVLILDDTENVLDVAICYCRHG